MSLYKKKPQSHQHHRLFNVLKFSKVLFFFLIYMLLLNNLAFSQVKKEKKFIKPIKKTTSLSLRKQIFIMQKDLIGLLKEYYEKTRNYPSKQIFKTIATDEKILNGENTKSFIDKIRKKEKGTLVLVFGRGSKRPIGSRTIYVFKEQAEVVMNNGSVSALSFIYIQSNHDSLYTEGRIIKNPNIQNDNLDNLEISSYTNLLKSNKYIFKNILNQKVRTRILYDYRGYLNKMTRIVKYVIYLIEKEEEVDIKRIMNIGHF